MYKNGIIIKSQRLNLFKISNKKWYVIADRNNGHYDKGNDKRIKIDTEVVKPFLCDYVDAYILVTGNITVVGGDGNTKSIYWL